MAANTFSVSVSFHTTFTRIALLTGYHLCGVGVAGILIVPTARVWGKRHLFLLGNLLMVVSCAWAGGSNLNYNSLLWARIFQGVALAPFEALVNATVGDLYFVHVRLCVRVSPETDAKRQAGTREENGPLQCCSLRGCFSHTCRGRQDFTFQIGRAHV